MLRNLLLLAFLACTALCILPNHYHFPRLLNKAARTTANDAVSVTAGFMSQYLDHFSGNVSGTFTQRYFYSQEFTMHAKTAFLYVANTGDFEVAVLTDERNPLVKSARQFGASVFALEHRFYGMSRPTYDTYNGQNLRYLNSFQAIQDIIAFIKFANVQYQLDPDVRWVLWGAGYGGVIAAEARKWDPVTISGVIASSAPMDHVYDFWAFNTQVQNLIMQEGGSLCYDKVQQGFADIRLAMTTPEGRTNISNQFQLNPRLDQTNLTYNDIQMFYLAIIAPFQEVIQFNNDFNLSISDMCTNIDKSNWSPMEVIWQGYVYLSTTVTGAVQPIVTSYAQIVADLGDPAPTNPYIDQRMWQWQVCTEFGWFYTTNNNENGLFGAVVPTSLFINQCIDFFPDANLSATVIRDLTIDYQNFYMGANTYQGTNAVFTNGLMDPWAVIGKETSGDFSVVAYLIPMASQAADFFPGDNNNTFIQQAHRLMAENINIWVNQPRNPKTFVNTTIPWTRPYWGEFGIVRGQMFEEKANIESKFSKLGDDVPSKKQFPKSNFKKVLLGRPPHGFLPEPEYDMNAATFPPGYEEGTFRQRFSHFDNTNPNYFQQKYFKNSQWAKPGGPNFLMIGGEGPESGRWVLNENITYLTWAKKYGATVYLLEHRFYGDSVVGDNMSYDLLNSLQMLYDLAEFIKAMNARTGTSNPWITFGGSYSGAMSAWMREVFPDLVIGAVASSGPVFAKTDFYEYLMVVENSIRTYNSGCADNIQAGFDTMRQLYQTKEGRQNLSTIFQLVPAFGDNVTDVDQHYFFSNIYGNFQGAVQYSGDNSGPYATGYGIPDMCNIMTNASNTPLQNIVNFNQFMSVFYTGVPYQGTDNNYQDMVDYLKNAQSFGPDDAASVLWTWQTCTEFGYFQSADSGNGIFGSPSPVNMYIQLCQDVFNNGYDRAMIDRLIDFTNYKYGERNYYRGTNVVMPNGNVDPWHALGLYYPNDKSVVPYLINGTAHCADMYPARDADVPGLKIVRDLIDTNIALWLSQANQQSSAAPPTSTVAPPATTTTVLPGTVSVGGSTTTVPVGGSTATVGSTATASTNTASTSTAAPPQTTTKSASSATVLVSFVALIARYFL